MFGDVDAQIDRAVLQDKLDIAKYTIENVRELVTMHENNKKLLTLDNLAHWLQRNTTRQQRLNAKQISEHFGVKPGTISRYLFQLTIDPKYKVNRIIMGNKYQYYGYYAETIHTELEKTKNVR